MVSERATRNCINPEPKTIFGKLLNKKEKNQKSSATFVSKSDINIILYSIFIKYQQIFHPFKNE